MCQAAGAVSTCGGTRTGLVGFFDDPVLACLQGAAFDVSQEVGEAMMANAEELTKRGFTIDTPTSLPQERFGGGGNRGADRCALALQPLRLPFCP